MTGEGSVSFISPYFGIPGTDQGPNTLMVKATFPNLTGQLKTGQFVKSQIITGNKQALAVPVQDVFMQAQQTFVYKLVPLSKALPKIKASTSIRTPQRRSWRACQATPPWWCKPPCNWGRCRTITTRCVQA